VAERGSCSGQLAAALPARSERVRAALRWQSQDWALAKSPKEEDKEAGNLGQHGGVHEGGACLLGQGRRKVTGKGGQAYKKSLTT
jgi:hypothetical protein